MVKIKLVSLVILVSVLEIQRDWTTWLVGNHVVLPGLVWNKPRPAQVGARFSFLNMQRILFLNFYYFLSAENNQRIRISLGNHIIPYWKQNIHFSRKTFDFSEKSHSAEKGTLGSKSYLFSRCLVNPNQASGILKQHTFFFNF